MTGLNLACRTHALCFYTVAFPFARSKTGMRTLVFGRLPQPELTSTSTGKASMPLTSAVALPGAIADKAADKTRASMVESSADN
jgi:hypothetical protein